MGYATYDDYLLLYGGSRLTEDEFLSAAEDASAEVDRYVFGRISAGAEITTDVKKAVCAAAEAIIDRQASMSRGSISSENVDGYSVSYGSPSSQLTFYAKQIRQRIGLYIPAWHPLRSRWC